jgi:hypothetical protein
LTSVFDWQFLVGHFWQAVFGMQFLSGAPAGVKQANRRPLDGPLDKHFFLLTNNGNCSFLFHKFLIFLWAELNTYLNKQQRTWDL